MNRIWHRRGVRLALGGLAFAALTLVTVLIAEPRMYSGFAAYDDEGYMLIALRSFHEHGHLYDDVFSQYGPFYYEFWGGFFELFGIPVDHDGGRAAAIFAWVTASLLFGVATWRMTRSILLGLATQMLVFGSIITVVNEPMHPGGTICLLLGAIVALSCLVRARPSPLGTAFLGASVAALILVKINVGAFALIAVALACAVSYPELQRRRWLRPAVEILFVAVPLLLMTSKAGEPWARHYAVHVAVAALAIVVALRARSNRQRPGEELWWLGGGILVLGLTVCVAILAAGTSPGGLVEGVLSQPLRQTDAFSIPLALANRTYLFDLLGLAGAIAFWYLGRGRGVSTAFTSLAAVLSIVVGLEMALATIGKTALFDLTAFAGYQFAFLPFAWVALMPVAGPEDEDTSFARLLLPPLAVLQALHAFPVAGSQIAWSTFLLIPVGALCVANGARTLARILDGERERRALGAIAAVAAAVTLVVLVNIQLRQPLESYRDSYDGLVSLDLPGAEDVRLSPEEVDLYRGVARTIAANCNSLLMLPGMNSFYFWSGLEPPTGYNATGWTTLFDDAHQQRVIDETRDIRGLCVLENEPIAAGWSSGTIPAGEPLVRYLRSGFRPIATIGDYRLSRREGTGGAS
ncbi:MAG TPA: hypothetical protein VNR67_01995 [Solirubrobacterales bacterium]|nr:hypothetical protein [Solirubrobacterales bacterium]